MSAPRLVLLLALVGSARGEMHATADASVTFNREVAPILFKHCTSCHRSTSVAPFSLINYSEARPLAASIKKAVAARTMPPWFADGPAGLFKNDSRLTPKEIATIVSWVDSGARSGNESDLPALPRYDEGWTIGRPDAVFDAEPVLVPARGAVPYQYLRIPLNVSSDRWIQAFEIRPGDRSVVHHVIATAQRHDPSVNHDNTIGSLAGLQLGGTTPNKPGIVYEPGVARLLPAHSDIVLQIHYTPKGTAVTDRTSVGV